jgi:ribosomal protein S18 acetylase RimI-like enzyme
MDLATDHQIAKHLHECAASFIPPLGSRVDIDAYAAKIIANATRFEAWASDDLAGLVAVYCNEPAGTTAFITSVSVVLDLRARGVADRLLTDAIAFATGRGFRRVSLEVGVDNAPALALYRRHGFTDNGPEDGSVHMELALRETWATGGRD